MIENFEANSQRAHFTHSGDKRKLHRGTSEIGSKTDFAKIEHYVWKYSILKFEIGKNEEEECD